MGHSRSNPRRRDSNVTHRGRPSKRPVQLAAALPGSPSSLEPSSDHSFNSLSHGEHHEAVIPASQREDQELVMGGLDSPAHSLPSEVFESDSDGPAPLNLFVQPDDLRRSARRQSSAAASLAYTEAGEAGQRYQAYKLGVPAHQANHAAARSALQVVSRQPSALRDDAHGGAAESLQAPSFQHAAARKQRSTLPRSASFEGFESAACTYGAADAYVDSNDDDDIPLELAPSNENTSGRGAAQVKYRPSHASNEDTFDFAIIVRAVFNAKQEAQLASARAQADTIMRATAEFRQRVLASSMGNTDEVYPELGEGMLDTHTVPTLSASWAKSPAVRRGDIELETVASEDEAQVAPRHFRGQPSALQRQSGASNADSASESDTASGSDDSEERQARLHRQGRGENRTVHTAGHAHRPHRCAEILDSLRAAGLNAKRVRSLNRQKWLIKVRAPEDRLEIEAERVHLRMRRRDGGWSRFKRANKWAFQPIIEFADACEGVLEERDGTSLFHSSDRQMLLDTILRSSTREGGADLGENSPLGAYVISMFPLHMYQRLFELRNDWLYTWRPTRSDGRFDRIGPARELPVAPTPLPVLRSSSSLIQNVGGLSPHVSGNCCLTALHSMCFVDPEEFEPKASDEPKSNAYQSPARSKTAATGASALQRTPGKSAVNTPGQHTQKSGLPAAQGAAVPPDDNDDHNKLCRFGFCNAICCCCVSLSEPEQAQGRKSTCRPTINALPLKCCRRNRCCLAICCASASVARCGRSASRCCTATWDVPLDKIASYFGEEVAFYFGFMQFYASWLILPSILGIFLFVSQLLAGTIDVFMVPVYSLSVALWSIVFLEMWRAKNMELAHRWGVLNFEQEEATRPQFRGDWVQDRVTGEVYRTYPKWKRAVKYSITIPVTATWVAGITVFMLYVFRTRDEVLAQLEAKYGDPSAGATSFMGHGAGSSNTTEPDDFSLSLASFQALAPYSGHAAWWLAMVAPPIAYGLLIPTLDFLFSKLATRMNSWENHKTQTLHQNFLIAKVFVFRFVNSFVSLYYYAFSDSQSVLQLAVQLAAFMVAGQLWTTLFEMVYPACRRRCAECRFQHKVQRAEQSGVTEGKRGRRLLRHAKSAAWGEARLPEHDSFEAWANVLLTFGFVTFFSWAFPLAPVLAWLRTLAALRITAVNLSYNTRRPIARKASGIGVWFTILQIMSMLALLTNCAHMALASSVWVDYFPNLSSAERMLVVFLLEHVVLAMRVVLGYMLPSTPTTVKTKISQDNFFLSQLNKAAPAGRRLTMF